jgi:nitroreductase
MDVFEAVESRIACRQFLERPVDPKIVKDLIVRAQRAPSGGNLQPWFVYALTGAPLAELKRRAARAVAGKNPRQFPTEYPVYPEKMWEPYFGRRDHHGIQLYGALGVDRSDHDKRIEQFNHNFNFFNAPVGLFIAIDRKLGPGQWSDLGGYIQTLACLARGHGLDTCPQEAWARLHGLVRDVIEMPPEQMLFCGMAIGYGDRSHPANSFHSPRAELSEFCKLYGFD